MCSDIPAIQSLLCRAVIKQGEKGLFGVKGKAGSPPCPYGQSGMARWAICLLSFHLLSEVVFASPGIFMVTRGIVECVS